MTGTLQGSLWFVSVADEPVKDLVTQERELAATRLAMGWDDAFSDPGTNDLLVRVQQVSELMGVHHRWHLARRRGPTALVSNGFPRTTLGTSEPQYQLQGLKPEATVLRGLPRQCFTKDKMQISTALRDALSCRWYHLMDLASWEIGELSGAVPFQHALGTFRLDTGELLQAPGPCRLGQRSII